MASAINSDNGVVSGTAGLKSSADSSGVLDLQTNGTTAISISASQVVSFTNQPTYTGGTANGVMFLNGSKAVTTGTALTFDGSQLDIPLGSAATPSLSTPTDPNTGMFFPAADTIAFAEGGVEAMRIDSNGNMGIGTTSPASDARLTIASPTTESYVMFSRTNSGIYDVAIGNNGGSIVFKGGADSSTVAGLTEFMRLDSVGNLGLGTTPSSWGGPFDAMQLGTYGQHIAGQTNTADLKIGTNNYYNGSNYVYTVTGFNAMQIQLGQGVFNVSAAPSGTAGATAALTQIIAVAADQSVALQGATSQSGTGITFPATQSASSNANTLDDYEEGTWTPLLRGANTAGSYTLSEATASYVKIGRQVTVNCIINVSAVSAAGVGYAQITGLPFTNSQQAQGPVYFANVNLDASCMWCVVEFISGSGQTIVYFDTIRDNTSSLDTDISGFTTNSNIRFALTYFTST